MVSRAKNMLSTNQPHSPNDVIKKSTNTGETTINRARKKKELSKKSNSPSSKIRLRMNQASASRKEGE